MTDIEQKAQALLVEIRDEASKLIGFNGPTYRHLMRWADCVEALCQAIEQHEAFRREVSDAVAEAHNEWCAYRLGHDGWDRLVDFIIPKPVDPLVEALAVSTGNPTHEQDAHDLREAMKARGYEWTKIEGAA